MSKRKKKLEDLEIPKDKEYPVDCYANRELSWLKFNERVLEEAEDPDNPLCEQFNFINIFQSNLDEFFMVRAGTLYDERKSDVRDNKTHMTSREQLNAALGYVRSMIKSKDKCYSNLIAKLKLNNIEVVHYDELSGKEKRQAARYFFSHVQPLLSPQIITAKQPFPFLASKEIYTVVLLEERVWKEKKKNKGNLLGIIPSSGTMLKRLVPVSIDKKRYILVEELIRAFVPEIFDQYRVLSTSLVRIVRSADISIDDDQQDDLDLKSKDYRKAVERMIATRKRLGAIKLEYTGKFDTDLIGMLCANLKLPIKHTFYSASPLDLNFLYTISDMLSGNKELFYVPRAPQMTPDVSEKESMFDQIRRKDVLLSYPYESMRPFLKLLNEAATDPNVVSIRITLYRVAKTSQVIAALTQAAENGKDVLALVELRARFDEENNLDQSRELENAGCRIIYGLDNIKVHSKLCLITRKTDDGVEYFTQIGTGNYNEKTARLYTDYSLMTADPSIGEEAADVFKALAQGKTVEHTDRLLVAPNCLQPEIIERLDRQIDLAKLGRPAYAAFKLNALTDKTLIDKLIEASAAGVKIQMLVRGICCLVTGVPGYTDNIEIYSIVGRYLEHSRVYIFGCDGNEEVFIASADLMTRNTERRVEVAVPVIDKDLRSRILDDFRIMLSDNCKLRVQLNDNTYVKVTSDKSKLNAQEFFAARSYKRAGVPLPEENNTAEVKEEPAKEKKEETPESVKQAKDIKAEEKKSEPAPTAETAAASETVKDKEASKKTEVKKTKKKGLK